MIYWILVKFSEKDFKIVNFVKNDTFFPIRSLFLKASLKKRFNDLFFLVKKSKNIKKTGPPKFGIFRTFWKPVHLVP